MTIHRTLRLIAIGTVSIGFGLHALRLVAQPQGTPEKDLATSRKVGFQKDIQPIFEKSCYSCHGPNMQMSGLRLDTKQSAFAGGKSGKVILPGKASEINPALPPISAPSPTCT